MRAVLIQLFGSLAVLASNADRGRKRDIHDGLVASTPDISSEGTGLYKQWPQLGSVPVNRTEGSIRTGKRQSNNLLESRQSNVCLDPTFILVCPITDPYPCCDPKFPICCHTATCCPVGTFCVGQKTCCQTGTVACGEGCCPTGTVCCDTACCTTGYTCVGSGNCQQNSVPTTLLATTTKTSINTFTSNQGNGNDNDNTQTSTQTDNVDNNKSNSPKKAAVIGGTVGGVIGGIVLIGGGITAWILYGKAHAAAAAAASKAGTAQPQAHGWTSGGAPGSPSVGQPLMTGTSMPFTPVAAGVGTGFAAQQAYGAPGSPFLPSGSPYQQPPTPSNGTDYNQPLVSQYPHSAYGAAAPSGSTPVPGPWAAGQAYDQPGGFVAPDTTAPGSHPNYYAGTPAPSNAGGSTYGGMAPEPMQPGQGAFGGFDSSTAYAQTPSPGPGPQVQTWVERSGGR